MFSPTTDMKDLACKSLTNNLISTLQQISFDPHIPLQDENNKISLLIKMLILCDYFTKISFKNLFHLEHSQFFFSFSYLHIL